MDFFKYFFLLLSFSPHLSFKYFAGSYKTFWFFGSLGHFGTPNHGNSLNVIGLMRKSFLKQYSQDLATTPLHQHLRSINANEFWILALSFSQTSVWIFVANKADPVVICYILRSLNPVVAIYSIQRPVDKSQPCFTISFLKTQKISPEASLDFFPRLWRA